MTKGISLVTTVLVTTILLSGCSNETQEPIDQEVTLVETPINQEVSVEVPAVEETSNIVFNDFTPGMTISSPYTIRGQAKRSWFAQEIFGIDLIAPEGEIITSVPASSDSPMDIGTPEEFSDDDMINFTAIIEFDLPSDFEGSAKLRFVNINNIDDLGEYSDYIDEAVILSQ